VRVICSPPQSSQEFISRCFGGKQQHLKGLEHLKAHRSARISECGWAQARLHQLCCKGLSGAAAAEVESDSVDSVAVDYDELVVDNWAGVGASLPVDVTELDSQLQIVMK
jgi:hypothetical protein